MLRIATVVAAFLASPLLDQRTCYNGFHLCSVLHAEKELLVQVVGSIPLTGSEQQEEERQHRALYIKKALSLNDNELEKLIAKRPRLLQLQSEKDVMPRLALLKARLSLSNHELKKFVQCNPQSICQPQTTSETRLKHLQEYLSLHENELRKIVLSWPSVLSYSIEDLDKKLAYLVERLSLGKDDLRKLVKKAPRILGCSMEENLEKKLSYLQQRLLLDEGELCKLVPHFFLRSVPRGIEPVFATLTENLSLTEKELSKMILRHPRILCHSSDFIDKKLLYWKEKLQLEEVTALKKIALAQPSGMFLSSDNVEHRLEYLQSRLSLSDSQLVSLIVRSFGVVCLAIDNNLQPKIMFIEKLLGFDEMKELLLRCPYVLMASLENRLKPRMLQMQKLGLPIDQGAISRIQSYSEARWSKSITYQTKKLLQSKGGHS